MKKNIIFIGLTTITLLIMIMVNSCSKDNNIVDAVNPQEQVSTHFIELTTQENTMLTVLTRPTPKVSTSEVEEIVDNFFNSSVSAKNIIPLKKNGISKSSETDVDTMMYIVDFNDKEGWVIVSGDVRVPQKILAYSDEGVIDTTDESGFSIFMDYLISYYDNCVVTFENEKDSLIEILYEKKTFEDTDTSINLSKSQHNESYGMTEKKEPYIPWHNIMRINPLVPVTWKQRDEYNDVLQKIHGKDHRLGCTSLATVQLMTYWKYPNNFDANGIRINWNDITREKSISDYGSSESEQAIKLQIQTLCYVVSGLCNTWYMKNNSMSFPKNSLEVLGNLGYRVPDDFILYKKSRIEESLKNSCPVIAYGASETTRKWSTALVIITLGTVHKTIPAHVWLIDGFIKQEKTDIKTITYTNVPDKLSKRQPLLQPEDGGNSSSNNTNITDNSNHIVQKKYYVKSYREFIHMNWGWGDETTKCWYLADVFDCSDAYTEYNGSLTYNELDHDSNFSNVHIATDIHPKQ